MDAPMNTTRRPRCLVVYESMFDNTEDIAWAISDGLAGTFDVDRTDVIVAPDLLDGISLLVVGAPTHSFGLSRPTTRSEAAIGGAEPDHAAGIGVREWLHRVERPTPGLPAAAFDTRLRRPRPPGSAARAIRRRLRRLGCVVLGPPASFCVVGRTGPLVDGEVQRAEEWGRLLATTLGPAAPPVPAHCHPTAHHHAAKANDNTEEDP
jgi:hypothetical protein